MIDLHSHVLPGIDDGPRTIEDSIELARAAHAGGTRVMVATSHVSWQYPNRAITIARLTDELNDRLQEEGIAVEIRCGAEIAMTRVEEIEPEELERLRLGDGPWVLLEPPFTPVATGLEGIVARLQRAGHRVLLAHPERCPALQREPQIVESLVREGVLTSVTAGSLVGRFGGQVRRFARTMVAQGLVHNVASDAHDTVKRPPGMVEEIDRGGFGPLTDWLTDAVPAAILSDGPIPPRPEIVIPAERAHSRIPWRRR